MAIKKNVRIAMQFDHVFPKGLVLLGEITPDIKYDANPNTPKEQRVDLDKNGEGTGLRRWKATVTDPDQEKAKSASFPLIFLSSHQPVPSTPEIVAGTGMRMIELEGLLAQPTVVGQGEFKTLGWTFFAAGITGDTDAPKTAGTAAGKAAA